MADRRISEVTSLRVGDQTSLSESREVLTRVGLKGHIDVITKSALERWEKCLCEKVENDQDQNNEFQERTEKDRPLL